VKLPNEITAISELTQGELQYLLKIIDDRWEFIYGDAHGVGYLLDPRYLGDRMDPELRKSVEDFIFHFPNVDGTPANDEKQEEMFAQYTKFRILAENERSTNTFRFRMLQKRKKTVLEYWQTDGNEWPMLKDLAMRAFSMVASSAASEQNFSTFGFVHSKLRNCLSPKSVEKLVYIKSNSQEVEGPHDDYASGYSSAEEIN
jgi:hypothetical protein